MEQENVQEVETETTATEEVENNSENVEKVFTQEEVNKIVAKEKARATKNIPSKEDLAQFNEWKESQKSQEDKYNDLIKSNGEKDTTISNLKMENEVLKAGITDADEIEFIIYKVGKMEGNFSDNLKEYLADNPKFAKKQETKATGIETKTSSATKDDGVLAILKAKHPDIDF
jgi:hypothetical protein